MKIIGKGPHDRYICEVSHTEIEKFLDRYYGNLDRIKVGDEIDLAKGYDFAQRAESACKKTTDLIESNKEIIKTIFDGVTFLGERAPRIDVQGIVEGLVQWDAFQKIWGESTPHQKQYVRELLGERR